MKTALQLGLWLLLAAPLSASTVLPIDFAQLSQAAYRIVGGRITTVTAARDPQNGYIYSTVTMRISQAVPAQLAGREYSFRMIGGELGDKVQYIADYPRFQTGDNVVLFLAAQTSTVFGPTVGLGQGVFFIESDSFTGLEQVTDQMRQPVLAIQDNNLVRGLPVTKEASAEARASGAKPRTGLKLDEFFHQVRMHRALGSASSPLGR